MKLYGKDKPKDLMSVAEEELIKRGELWKVRKGE